MVLYSRPQVAPFLVSTRNVKLWVGPSPDKSWYGATQTAVVYQPSSGEDVTNRHFFFQNFYLVYLYVVLNEDSVLILFPIFA